jgi:hypothetical protein
MLLLLGGCRGKSWREFSWSTHSLGDSQKSNFLIGSLFVNVLYKFQVPFNELIVENTTFLISPDHEPEFWSKDPFYINATTTAIVPTSVLLAENETMKLAFDSPIVSAVKLAIFMSGFFLEILRVGIK